MAAARREDRVLISRIGAHARWSAETDRTAATAPACRGLRARFERQVDPDRRLAEAERDRLVNNAMRAHMARLALRSAQARRARRATD